ncbi:hypothetical protein NRIC_23790 [Enterococcus florum]|uniref:RDD domain-containing protein n=1 Tax=Enterococcus florum TaxID=2480627 RepID=A0A4P5PEC4_9ENTE|nr:RDD family protein [Enterococcus florum]GCF94488.1 hypothetical protein NRIC_23790 [Enterococcus florum]
MTEDKKPAVGPKTAQERLSQAAIQQDKTIIQQFHGYPNYYYAGFWIRMFAFLLDTLCITAITNVLIGSIFNLINLEKHSELFSPYGVAALVVYLLYFILLTKINHGQTIGKMAFGIRVVCFQEEILSWKTVLIREGACRFILKNPFFMLGYLLVLFTPNKQHLGDFFTDTSVVTINLLRAEMEGINLSNEQY